MKNIHKIEKELYITNDENIKEGEYYIHGERLHKHLGKKCLDVLTDKEYTQSSLINKDSVFKKIILTTDQDLIADGVQSIDDEFLEWFVKNLSCDFVKVEVDLSKHNGQFQTKYGYKIIIPKEEHNPFELPKALPDDVFYESLEPKQETLEEVSERYANMQEDVSETIGKYLVKAVFKDGAYWNQEQIYNEIKELYDNENITGFSKLAYAKCLDIIKNK